MHVGACSQHLYRTAERSALEGTPQIASAHDPLHQRRRLPARPARPGTRPGRRQPQLLRALPRQRQRSSAGTGWSPWGLSLRTDPVTPGAASPRGPKQRFVASLPPGLHRAASRESRGWFAARYRSQRPRCRDGVRGT